MLHEIIEGSINYLVNNGYHKDSIDILDRTKKMTLIIHPSFYSHFIDGVIERPNRLYLFTNHYWDIHMDDDYALTESALQGHLKVVKFLVNCGADIHIEDDYLLGWSAYKGYFNMVKFLVKCGADIHARNDEALKYSAEKGHLKIVKFLVGLGANISADDDYALRYSAKEGHLEVAHFLVNCYHRKKYVSSYHRKKMLAYDNLINRG